MTIHERLAKKERQERILERLNSDVTVRILTLAELFGVTTETIRRDIDALTDQGLVSRTYGGAASMSLSSEPDMERRTLSQVAERERIAAFAAQMISPGDVLMVDAGSSTAYFARALAARHIELTILTNCLPVARTLGTIKSVSVILCPGNYRETESGTFGHETTDFLERFTANRAIISAGGLNVGQISDADTQACAVKRKMIERAEQATLLMDSSKFGKQLFSTLGSLDTVTDLITDAAPTRDIKSALRKNNVQVHVAP